MILSLGSGASPGPTGLDHVLIALITLFLPIHDLLFWYPRLLRASSARRSRARSRAYLESAVIEWALVALVLGAWLGRDRRLPELGLGAPSGWGFYGAALLALGGIAFATWQRISLTRDPNDEVRRSVLGQIEPLRPLLPHSRGELRGFMAVSITAGICEEVLFRGYLLWYLGSLIPFVPALLVGAGLFGMAHAYQGTRGILQTSLVGLGLVALYVISGSLWVPMALHAFVDLNSGLLAYTFLKEGAPGSLPEPPTGLGA